MDVAKAALQGGLKGSKMHAARAKPSNSRLYQILHITLELPNKFAK
jgi:hypothetical protein